MAGSGDVLAANRVEPGQSEAGTILGDWHEA